MSNQDDFERNRLTEQLEQERQQREWEQDRQREEDARRNTSFRGRKS